MESEVRTALFDNDLHIEVYDLENLGQKYPSHFHEKYEIGVIEAGRLICNHTEYVVDKGDLLLFNPSDNHACDLIDGKPLNWKVFIIDQDIMRQAVKDIKGHGYLPRFTSSVAFHSDAIDSFYELHKIVTSGQKGLIKEEAFYFFLEQLLSSYTESGGAEAGETSDNREEIQKVCEHITGNYTDTVTLDSLSKISGLNKFTLLRSFTVQKGITPYQYFTTVRVNNAKKLLEAGVAPIEVALQTGFSDQSHFTRVFKNLAALTPKQYQRVFKTLRD